MRRANAALLLALTLTLAACAGVLGLRRASTTQRPFEHHAHVITGLKCTGCHEGISTAKDDSPLHIPEKADCQKCHAKAHHPERECNECHGSRFTRASAQAARDKLRFDHSTHVPRVKGNCVQCHQGVTNDAEVIRPPMALCLGCHQHKDEFATRKCDGCHRDLKGEHLAPGSHIAHDADWIKEHGSKAAASQDLCSTCHAQSSCAKCHGVTTAALAEKLAFDDPARMGAHRAGFFARHSAEARLQPGLCTTCHAPKSCADCHADRKVSPLGKGKSPHAKGWLGLKGQPNDHGRAAWLDPAECASCHGGAGEALCVGCHKVGGSGGNPHRAGWTSKLRPAVDQPCRLCHGTGP